MKDEEWILKSEKLIHSVKQWGVSNKNLRVSNNEKLRVRYLLSVQQRRVRSEQSKEWKVRNEHIKMEERKVSSIDWGVRREQSVMRSKECASVKSNW